MNLDFKSILSYDTLGIIFRMKASIEFWENLEQEHYKIPSWSSEQWEMSGFDENDSHLWRDHISFSLSCTMVSLGESVGCTMKYDTYRPRKDLRRFLTGNHKWDEQIVRNCFKAFLELYETEIDIHEFYQYTKERPLSLCEWIYEHNDLWIYEDLSEDDWRKNTIIRALNEVDSPHLGCF